MGRWIGGLYGNTMGTDVSYNQTKGVFTTRDQYYIKQEGGWSPPLGGAGNPATGPQALYDDGQRTNGLYYLNPDGGTAGQFYCWLSGGTTFADNHSGSYGWALAMRWNHPHFFGNLMANHWDGRPSGASGPNITDSSTWDGTGAPNGKGQYTPNSATHVLFGFTNDNDNTLSDWTHTEIPGDTSSNTGFFRTTMSSVSEAITKNGVQSSVSGGGSYNKWHFRPTNSSYYYPIGVSNGLTHDNNCDNTNSLLGVMNDGCSGSTQNRNGITPNWGNNSETYVGNRKNLDGGNGAGGAYCVSANSNADRGKWMMWWR